MNNEIGKANSFRGGRAFEAVGTLSGIGFYAAALVIGYDVINRLIGLGTTWPLEVYPYLSYWAALLGVSYITYYDGNVKMDLLVEEGWLGPLQKLQPTFVFLVSLTYAAYMAWAGFNFVLDLESVGRVTYDLRTPLYLHAIALPLGFSILALALIVRRIVGGPKASGH